MPYLPLSLEPTQNSTDSTNARPSRGENERSEPKAHFQLCFNITSRTGVSGSTQLLTRYWPPWLTFAVRYWVKGAPSPFAWATRTFPN